MKNSRSQTSRSHTCGILRKSDVEKKVCLYGWVHRRRDHGGLIFIDLRDRYGITQIVFDPKIASDVHEKASSLRSEWVVGIEGKVRHRGEGLENKKIPTGDIEIEAYEMKVFSPSKMLPFSICDEKIDVNEELRLKFRYLDIRRGEIIKNLAIRHKAMLSVREFLDKLDFLEVATPVLAKSTPEGARDYLIPSRLYPGNFFALPQSPQIFKQLLMVSGLDRYFQIAPCFRDEDLRSDRQPEFTQIDIEMSFSSPEELFEIVENLMSHIFKTCLNVKLKTPFIRMKHSDAQEKYGTDKPDLRFGMPFCRIDDIIKTSNFDLLKKYIGTDHCIKALCVKGGATFSRKEIDTLTSFVAPFGLNGLAWMKYKEGQFTSNIVKFFGNKHLETMQSRLEVEENDLILIAASEESVVNQALDHLRRHIAKKQNLIDTNTHQCVWITDFPMFTMDKKTGQIKAEHHPFTQPRKEDIPLLDESPLKAQAIAYDLVMNGYELASGSERIYDQDIQNKVFQILKLSASEIQQKFGFFMEALQYGSPPTLGVAFGLDRLIMILVNTTNIRDVIAFPKTQKASDLMMQAPSFPQKEHLEELKIQTLEDQIQWI